jgi:hypothetical protein
MGAARQTPPGQATPGQARQTPQGQARQTIPCQAEGIWRKGWAALLKIVNYDRYISGMLASISISIAKHLANRKRERERERESGG